MTARQTNDPTSSTELVARRNELQRRLHDGDVQISAARLNGADTYRWETHWIMLLREYETVCDQIAEIVPNRLRTAA